MNSIQGLGWTPWQLIKVICAMIWNGLKGLFKRGARK